MKTTQIIALLAGSTGWYQVATARLPKAVGKNFLGTWRVADEIVAFGDDGNRERGSSPSVKEGARPVGSGQ